MTTPAIITVAITGAIPRKADTPAVPVTPAEQIVMFRHAHCLTGGASASDRQACALVDAAVKACETYYQSFQFVLWAGRTPREALDFAMFATVGNA